MKRSIQYNYFIYRILKYFVLIQIKKKVKRKQQNYIIILNNINSIDKNYTKFYICLSILLHEPRYIFQQLSTSHYFFLFFPYYTVAIFLYFFYFQTNYAVLTVVRYDILGYFPLNAYIIVLTRLHFLFVFEIHNKR